MQASLTFTKLIMQCLLPLLLVLSMTPNVNADEKCDFGILCGDVINKTPFTMSATVKYNKPCNARVTHYCMIWNRKNGNTWAPEPQNPIQCCHQSVRANGGRMGTNGVDVDAFTFATTDYKIVWDPAGLYLPWGLTERSLKRGQWTKISSTQYVECTQTGRRTQPYCRIVGLSRIPFA